MDTFQRGVNSWGSDLKNDGPIELEDCFRDKFCFRQCKWKFVVVRERLARRQQQKLSCRVIFASRLLDNSHVAAILKTIKERRQLPLSSKFQFAKTIIFCINILL